MLKYREDHDVARAASLRWIADPARAAKEAAADMTAAATETDAG